MKKILVAVALVATMFAAQNANAQTVLGGEVNQAECVKKGGTYAKDEKQYGEHGYEIKETCTDKKKVVTRTETGLGNVTTKTKTVGANASSNGVGVSGSQSSTSKTGNSQVRSHTTTRNK